MVYINMVYLRRILEFGRCIGVECVFIVCKLYNDRI